MSPSGEVLHDSARLGAMLLPGIGFTRASCVASWTMNGVCWMFSAGSNQAGTRVVCTAHVIWPSGAAAPGATPTAEITRTRTAAKRPWTGLTMARPFLFRFQLHVLVRRGERIARNDPDP